MNRKTVLSFLFTLIININIIFISSVVYHEKTRIMFVGDRGYINDYFGYSVLLRSDGLYVGAPRAIKADNVSRLAGAVFICSLQRLDRKLVICNTMGSKVHVNGTFQPHITNSLMRSDSWFGSSLATLSENILLVTAPRLKSRYRYQNLPLQLQGACYLFTTNRSRILEPLAEDGKNKNQKFKLDGSRNSYGPSNESVFFYSLGQAGFSIAITKHNTVLLGAPGLMQFTGGIISYAFDVDDTSKNSVLQPIVNTYHTMELDTDDYFGYSVESGIFEKNGKLLHIGGAPRYNLGRGKVLIFKAPTDSTKPLHIRAKLSGPHIGSYFGASLCCTDLNNDGLDDLLVGAPTFVKIDDLSVTLPYDQGAVFCYITVKTCTGFILKEVGYISGSVKDGARFGTVIADLGDINGDGFRDIAIGAPWESNDVGAVYIYMGNAEGLNKEKFQRIQPADARGFGWSIAKGVDVDSNNCNDLAVGAVSSGASYLYRCIPTMYVRALIRVPDVVNLPLNGTTFTAMFCVCALPTKFRPDIKLDLIGRITADSTDNRATVTGQTPYFVTVTPGNEICDEKTIRINETADLFKPVILTFELKEEKRMQDDSTIFMMDAARLSDDSVLKTKLPIHITRDCNDKHLCDSLMNLTLEAFDNPYIPGTRKQFGVRLTVRNNNEPAYGVMIIISLPMNPVKIPAQCSLNNFTLNCDIPQPFGRNETIVWNIELEYNLKIGENISLPVTAKVANKFHTVPDNFQIMILNVTPEATFSISGKPMPNSMVIISRKHLAAGGNLTFQHFFEVTNLEPSDWHSLIAHIRIPERTRLTSPISGCIEVQPGYECLWSVPAKVSYPISISLQMDLSQHGNFLKRNINYNATSSIFILLRQNKYELKYMGYEVITALRLEPARIIWCVVIPCVFLGLLLLAIIVRILYKCGFFIRKYNILLAEKEVQLLKKTSLIVDPTPSQISAQSVTSSSFDNTASFHSRSVEN